MGTPSPLICTHVLVKVNEGKIAKQSGHFALVRLCLDAENKDSIDLIYGTVPEGTQAGVMLPSYPFQGPTGAPEFVSLFKGAAATWVTDLAAGAIDAIKKSEGRPHAGKTYKVTLNGKVEILA